MLINFRSAMMAGKRLPYDAELEYLESTGTQWIDTGVKINLSTDSIRMCIKPLTADTSIESYWGVYETIDGVLRYIDLRHNRNATNVNAYWPKETSPYYRTYVAFDNDAQWHSIDYDVSGMVVDGTSISMSDVYATTFSLPLFVFATNSSGSSIQKAKAQIASFAIVRNGVKILDFIPVRRGTVGYLYDRVSGALFGNAGTGDFVLGPDVVPVEYIESHGTEYIDTPWTPDLTTDMRISGRAGFATTNRGMLLSAYNSGSPDNLNISFELYSDLHFRVYAFADVFIRFKCADSIRQMFDYSIVYTALNGLLSCTANGIEASGTVLTQCRVVNTRPARLGADYRATNRYGLFGPVKVYNPGLIFDFTPVRVGTEGAMMDTITRRIYRNAGTGAFTYGNDLKYPIPAA